MARKSALDRLIEQRVKGSGPPAGPAGPIGKPVSQREAQRRYAAAHDRPAPQLQFDSGVRRGHAFTQGPLAGFLGDSRRRRRKF